MTAAILSALDSLLIWWSENPGIFLLFAVFCCVVAFRLAFLAGLKVTLKQESRAVQIERTKEHEARAANLRLVAKRMADKEVA